MVSNKINLWGYARQFDDASQMWETMAETI